MTPIEVSLLFAVGSILAALMSLASSQIAKLLGRVGTVVSISAVGTLALVGLAFSTTKVVGGLFFVLRFGLRVGRVVSLVCYNGLAGCFNSTDALEKSLLMDYVPEKQRARWSSVDSVASVTWSGSAELGALMLNKIGYSYTFLVTAGVLFVSLTPWVVLFAFIPRKECLPVPMTPRPKGQADLAVSV